MTEQETPVTGNEEEVVKTPEQVAEELAALKAEQEQKAKEYMRILEENRVALNTSTSSDVVQRIRALVDLLNVKISQPKYVTETIKGVPHERLVGSVELSLFRNYDDNDINSQFLNGITNLLVNRTIDLAKLL